MNAKTNIKTLVAALEFLGNPFEERKVDWMSELETKFACQLPIAFRELIANYEFPEFDVAGVTIFSNLNDGSDEDITVAPFSDPFMSPWLINHHFVQFGRPDTGSYDPVCFDLTKMQRDPTIVVLDHEDILQERKKVHVDELAPSFEELLQAGVNNKRLQPTARKTLSS